MICFDPKDCGCYADGAAGHEHVRERLASLLDDVQHPEKQEHAELIESLYGDMPDDAWDEDEALEVLDQYTDSRCAWIMEGGDLILTDQERFSP